MLFLLFLRLLKTFSMCQNLFKIIRLLFYFMELYVLFRTWWGRYFFKHMLKIDFITFNFFFKTYYATDLSTFFFFKKIILVVSMLVIVPKNALFSSSCLNNNVANYRTHKNQNSLSCKHLIRMLQFLEIVCCLRMFLIWIYCRKDLVIQVLWYWSTYLQLAKISLSSSITKMCLVFVKHVS